MKKVFSVLALVLAATAAFAQNPLTVELNHCQPYMTAMVSQQTHHFLFVPYHRTVTTMVLTSSGLTACRADKSTLYASVKTHNLRTNGGTDFFNTQLYAVGTAGATANYLAITSTSITPAVTDTTLSGELTTNGLARAQGSIAHTSGTGSSVLSKTWTYSGSTSTIINGVGLFNASSSGTMTNEAAVTGAPTVTNSGDTITINYTLSY